ncbi:MAG TPA: MATE family efflux transporter [Gemmatimonadaceae bacterium]|nr:MATE family efflux transporter [Gemmatimonadaceae bacterium]
MSTPAMGAPPGGELAPAHDQHPPQSLWTTLREAVRGSHRDLTTAPLGTAILLLAVPMVLEMAMESVFAVVDVFFVARLGAAAVATVGITESMLALIYTIAMGLSIGATATVARRIGEGDREAAAHSAAQALLLGIGVAIVLGVAGGLAAPSLLAAMGATPEILAIGTNYTRIMLGGNIAILMLFLINACFRGAGDAAIAMRVLWLANFCNIVLAPCFIFGLGPFPELGVTGAAVATTTGRSIGVLFAGWRLLRGDGRIAVARRHWKLDPALMGRIARLSTTGTFQILIGTASWIVLVRILTTFGAAAVAGYTIGMRVIVFAILPSFGMSNAAATLVGQSLGAKKPDRAEQAVYRAGKYNMVFLGALGVVFVVFAPLIVSIFTRDPEIARYASDCLRVVALGFLLYGWGMVLSQALNGAGDTRSPTVINFFVFWLFELPLAWTLAKPLGIGPHGVFIAIMLAFSLYAVAAWFVFRRGRWKTARV